MTVRKYGATAAILAVIFGLSACSGTPAKASAAAAAPATIKLQVQFAGGYGFAFSQSDGSVTALAPKDAAGTGMHASPQMRVLTPATPGVTSLAGYEVRIDGLAASAVTAPPEKALDPDCEKQAADVNNLAFLPDVAALVPKATASVTKDKLDTQLRLSGGALGFHSASGCWSVGGRAQAMVMGANDPTVSFNTTLTGDAVTVTLVPLGSEPALQPIRIAPSNGEVILILDWHSMATPTPLVRKKDDEMKDFSRAYSLLSVPAGTKLSNPTRVKVVGNEPKNPRPGDDCGSFRITVK